MSVSMEQNKKEITGLMVGMFCLPFSSHCCVVVEFPPPPSFPNILHPQKFDSTPYNSQGHLHLRPNCVESCCEMNLMISWFELASSLVVVVVRVKGLVTARLG
jgi:hypothetical protein